MNNTTNTRFTSGRSISTLRLASLSMGLLMIATVPVLASGQRESLPKSKPNNTLPTRGNLTPKINVTKSVGVKHIGNTTTKQSDLVTRTTSLPRLKAENNPVARSSNRTELKPVRKQTGSENGRTEAITGRLNDIQLNDFHSGRLKANPVLSWNHGVEGRPSGHALNVGFHDGPGLYRGHEFGVRVGELVGFSTGLLLMGMVTLPAAPPVIAAADIQTVVDFKLALIAADIKDLQDRIKDRQSREADITAGNVPGADPQQVPSMQAVDRSNQHEIDNLQAEADSIPKMTPKNQLKISRANFNSHISNLKRNEKSLKDRKAQLMQLPPSDGTSKAIDELDTQINQDESDINTLQQMSDQASALLK